MRLGISPRRFEGWEPQHFTTVTAWDGERPAAWSSRSESEWDAEDRAIVLALLDFEADICSGCGQLLSESLHVDGRPDPTYQNAFMVCTGCMAKERYQTQWEDANDKPIESRGGRVFRLARKWVLKRLT